MDPRLLFILLVLLSFHGAKSTFSPSGSVTIDCGGQQIFTCTITGNGPATWTIAGLQGIMATGTNGVVVANSNARITSAETVAGLTSTITITGFTTADNTGTVQCVDQAAAVEGSATVMIGLPSCPTNVRVTDRSSDFSSVTITWDQPTNSPPVTSYIVTCNSSSCTAMPSSNESSTSRVLSVSPCEDYSVTVLPMNSCGSSTGCTGNAITVPSQGPPQCEGGEVVIGSNGCPSFNFSPQGSVLPSTVVVSYRLVGGTSSAAPLNCDYPVDLEFCTLRNLPAGMYNYTLTPANSCGSPTSACNSKTVSVSVNCSRSTSGTIASLTDPVPIGLYVGAPVGGGIGVIVVGVSGYGITILIMGFTCYSSLGFLALLKCLCCPCCKGKARKSSSKQRIDSESPVTPPAQPPAQPPADEYADPQAIRDRKERGKEDKDKIQYAAIDFSAGAGSGAREVKIHQKEEPVIYTTVQHV